MSLLPKANDSKLFLVSQVIVIILTAFNRNITAIDFHSVCAYLVYKQADIINRFSCKYLPNNVNQVMIH